MFTDRAVGIPADRDVEVVECARVESAACEFTLLALQVPGICKMSASGGSMEPEDKISRAQKS